MIGIILITHSDFGAYLLEACEHIIGVKENVYSVSITSRMSVDDVSSIIKQKMDKMNNVNGIVFFVDIPGGTPMNVSLPFAKEIENSAVICGVNMPMLLSALNLKDNMNFNEFVDKVIMDGKKSICDVKTILTKHNKKD